MVKVSKDMYLLRFIYDKYKYGFVTIRDLEKDLGWNLLDIAEAYNILENWGLLGDQKYGELRDDPKRVGIGLCLDSKYATDYMFQNLYILEDMTI